MDYEPISDETVENKPDDIFQTVIIYNIILTVYTLLNTR